MSIDCTGVIEIRWPNSQMWFAAAKVYFYGDVQVYALLAHPWCPHEEGSDLPAPIVEPRGLPSDLGLMALHEVGESHEGKPPKGLKPLGLSYYYDPEKWRCLTWLTTEEIQRACSEYPKHHSKGLTSSELEGILGMMRGYEQRDIEVRTVLFFR